ncbi:TetR/AcrR family transcriptional regulator [Kutzneria buriramensis]|uniref:TetR/AcrR family transcriptional repressor of nem operon n=1 Tax=Kutzneria buriramensis TaxID=1045776 RepID=A0A3E0I6Z9_9PSEU|nr:TetR/AcrR family transcriptional regulator [Kutzneria buriramensis]REH54407.1 TetR/AcrR family transcriptional repressor of nem operon [Kutzneria buriramensis]
MPRHSVRDVIVETALGEFHRIGYAACSVDTITRAAGVPKGSFYNHFKSKEELAVEVVAKYTAEAGWHGVVDPALTPLAKLRAQFRVMGDVLVGNGYTRGCMIGNMGEELSDHSELMRAQVRASLGGWAEGIADTLRAAREAGELTVDADTDMLARFVLDAWEGALLRAKTVKTDEPLDDFFTTVFTRLLV